MRLLVYNIRYATGTGPAFHLPLPGAGYLRSNRKVLNGITDFISQENPDIVGLIEVDIGSVRSGMLNQADHRVAGLAAVDALRDAGNRWVFPELLDEGLQPHSARWLLAGGDPQPTHGVDVTGEPLEGGIASLEAHEQYLAGLPGHPAPRMMITGFTAWQGRSMGVPHAVLFRAWDFQSPPPIAAEIMAAMQAS